MPRIESENLRKEESPIEINRKVFADISLKVGQYLDFLYGSLYMLAGRHQDFAYPKKDWPQVEKLLTEISEMLSDLSKNEAVSFSPKNSLNHILGNYALMGQQMVEGRKFQKNISINMPLSPRQRENMKDIAPEDIEMFRDYKKEWDLILYYLELIEKNSNILETEIASEEGWLEEFKDFYNDKKIPVMDVQEKLKHINFFARIKSFSSELGDVRGLKNLVEPINEENFGNEFNQLPKNEFLDKESLRKYFPENQEHRQAA